ncbi:hypothetical protein HanRHA438_Chr10g0439741 [Helianthus annuus]|nr:hypothetical protein HanRHA438_Chr10g0439741 [Helianthus annuus]
MTQHIGCRLKGPRRPRKLLPHLSRVARKCRTCTINRELEHSFSIHSNLDFLSQFLYSRHYTRALYPPPQLTKSCSVVSIITLGYVLDTLPE